VSGPILPGATLGVLGGGQLGRMFVQAAQAMGYATAVLDPDADSPAGLISHHHIRSAYDDTEGLARLAELSDAITTEFENVPAPALAALAAQRPVAPGISASFHWQSWGWGLLAGGLLGALLAGFTPFKPLPALAMALVACVAGSLGHLVMKAIKRDRGVTHWGGERRSVTGAVGLLDRVDALCFAAPVFFHSVRWTFGL